MELCTVHQVCYIMVMIICILGGFVLGLLFRAPVLIPATLLCAALGLVAAVAHGEAIWFVLLMALLSVVALHTGFLSGVATRLLVARVRAPRSRLAGIVQ